MTSGYILGLAALAIKLIGPLGLALLLVTPTNWIKAKSTRKDKIRQPENVNNDRTSTTYLN